MEVFFQHGIQNKQGNWHSRKSEFLFFHKIDLTKLGLFFSELLIYNSKFKVIKKLS